MRLCSIMYNVSFKINYDKCVRHSVIIALMAEHRNLVSQLTVVNDCERIKKSNSKYRICILAHNNVRKFHKINDTPQKIH